MNAGPARTWTIAQLIAWCAPHFQTRGIDAPRLTAELLLGQVLQLSRVQLYMDLARPLQAEELARFRDLVRRRDAREPTQHLLGAQEFYGRPFKIDRRALIPRPETELLVEGCLTRLAPERLHRALEVGIGSGAIGLSLLAERPQLQLLAIDVSPGAAALALENAVALGVADRLDLREGDLFLPLSANERFDLIVSNPPYVASGVIETLEPEVREHDPRVALDGGPDGLGVLRRLIAAAPTFLLPGAVLALEIGDDQGAAVRQLLQGAGFDGVEIVQDYAELDRLASRQRLGRFRRVYPRRSRAGEPPLARARGRRRRRAGGNDPSRAQCACE